MQNLPLLGYIFLNQQTKNRLVIVMLITTRINRGNLQDVMVR